jgi:hypothetical protein
MRAKIAKALGVATGKLDFSRHRTARKPASKQFCTVEPLEKRELLTTYYVSPGGRDNAAGTSASAPWQSISRLNQQTLRPGDRVLLQGNATHYGTIIVNANESGDAKNPVVISSYNGRATINSGNTRAVEVVDGSGVAIDNLNLRGAGMYANGGSGIWIHSSNPNKLMKNIRVSNVDVSGYGYYGLKMEAPNSNSRFQDVRIEYASFHDSLEGGLWINGTVNNINKNVYIGHVYAWNHPGNGSGTKVTGNGIFVADVDGALIERSAAHDNGANGKAPVGIWVAGSNRVTIQNCESYNNKTNAATDGGGFDFDWDVTNSTMQYNYSHDNDGPGYLICGDNHKSDRNTIRYNISQNDARRNGHGAIYVYGNASNIKINNNTVYMSPTGNDSSTAFDAWTNGFGNQYNIDVRNNIFYTTGGVKLVQADAAFANNSSNGFFGNNYYSGGSGFNISWAGRTYGNVESWRKGSGREKINGMRVGYQGNPRLQGVGKGGKVGNANNLASALSAYKLQKKSPLINNGVNPNSTLSSASSDFFGGKLPKKGRYDIGANEF